MKKGLLILGLVMLLAAVTGVTAQAPDPIRKLGAVETLTLNTPYQEIVWSADGTHLAALTPDSAIQIIDAIGGNITNEIATEGKAANALDWSLNGQWLANGGFDAVLYIHDAATDENLLSYDSPYFNIVDMEFSPDSAWLAVVYNEESPDHSLGIGTIEIFDTSTWEVAATIGDASSRIGEVDWSPDGTQLAAAGYDSVILVWDTATWEETLRGTIGVPNIFTVDWSPDGSRVVTAYAHDIEIRTLSDWQFDNFLPGHTSPVTHVRYSPDGLLLASGAGSLDVAAEDHTVRIWNPVLQDSALLLTLDYGSQVDGIEWSPDGSRLAFISIQDGLHIYDITIRAD